MGNENVKSFEREAFKNHLGKLAGEKAIDNAVFADVVYTAISQFGLTEIQFRDAFGLSKGAVERWTTGQNLPQPAIRGKIILWVKDIL